MAGKIKQRLTYGNVVATLALLIALGGTSYAAITITSKNVRNNSLTSADVRNSSLTGSDIRNRSLTAADFQGALGAGPPGARGATGPAGPAGAAGAKGDKGDKGDDGDKGEAGDIFTAETLPPGETLRGYFNVLDNEPETGDVSARAISFAIPLASPPTIHYIKASQAPPADCPGSDDEPEASPGHMCIYESVAFNGGANRNSLAPHGRYGTTVWSNAASAASTLEVRGTWAVTAE